MSQKPVIVWFRDDLRLADHPALRAACDSGAPVICLFIREDGTPGRRDLGGAARWWLDRSLKALDAALRQRGNRLVLRSGPAGKVVAEVLAATGASGVFWNRRYDGGGIGVDTALKSMLRDRGVAAMSFAANLLREPWDVKSAAGTPMRIFTPFWRAHQRLGPLRPPVKAPGSIPAPALPVASESLDGWGLEPRSPNWAAGFDGEWSPGEDGAHETLDAFLDGALPGYAADRDRPDRASTSRLSPHLRFGEISMLQVWHRVEFTRGMEGGSGVAKFLAELGWREFSHHLLFHWPDLADRNFHERFDTFAWQDAPALLKAWRQGRTGYPIVDAGMRQLWRTGWMHNRVRMLAASFLVKHLRIDWRAGERWFWDTLVDADPASNPVNWQWIAGSGPDASPYFRIFNPVTQGAKFDPDGAFVRRWVPELAAMPDQAIHAPWEASRAVLDQAGVKLGETYPLPTVGHEAARADALAAFAATRGGNGS